MLERLKKNNNVPIMSVKDNCFKTYGRIIKGYDFSELIAYMDKTSVPESGNIYIASDDEMEKKEIFNKLQNNFYGGMDIQIGYCNGRNSTYNGFEYHKGSEINIAVTDFMLVLGHTWDIKNNTFDVKDAEVFYVEKGCAIEMYQTTLHLSPCKVNDEGFKDIVVLPLGTNTKLPFDKKIITQEDELLLLKNKWIIAHPKREPLVKQGAHCGVIGENIELFY